MRPGSTRACVRKRLEPRNGRGRCEKHGIARVVGQQPEALGGERREVFRNRQRLTGAHVLATPDERTPDLESVERVAPRRRLDVLHDEVAGTSDRAAARRADGGRPAREVRGGSARPIRPAARPPSSTSWPWPPPRAARRAPTGQLSRRRTANPSTPMELSSAHCTSSTATRIGDSAARRRIGRGSRPRECADPRPGPRDRPGAVRRRALAAAARVVASTPGETVEKRSPKTPSDRCASDLAGLDDRMRKPCSSAAARPVSQRAVFPIPGSPSRTSAANPPAARTSIASTATSSSPRPMISSRRTARATSRHSAGAASAAQGQTWWWPEIARGRYGSSSRSIRGAKKEPLDTSASFMCSISHRPRRARSRLSLS